MAILRKLADENLGDRFSVAHDIFRYKSYTVVAMDLLSVDLHSAYFQKHLSPRMIRPIACQIFSALVELDRLGIIHGDLKPMNIMLLNCKQMKVKVNAVAIGSQVEHLHERSFAVGVSSENGLLQVIDFSCATEVKQLKNHQPEMNVQTRYTSLTLLVAHDPMPSRIVSDRNFC